MSAFSFTTIADTGARFADFGPYVASIDDRGVVAFQATLRDGSTGVFAGSGDAVVTLASGDSARFRSHPDLDGAGAAAVYCDLASGPEALCVIRDGRRTIVADDLAHVGPLGPTMNDRGWVAFRGETRAGERGVFVWNGDSIVTIADTRRFRAFHGLPVIDARGRVVFRADGHHGREGIYAGDGGAIETLVETGERFARLGAFPCAGDAGTVVFAATLAGGGSGIFDLEGPVVESGSVFERVRGALVNDAGTIVVFATPVGGTLGIYGSNRALRARLVGIGEPMFGSRVADFALNPVSINGAGQLAIRVALDDGRQLVVRADPVRPAAGPARSGP